MNVHYKLKITRSLIGSTLLAVSLAGCAASHKSYNAASNAELKHDYETAMSEYKAALDRNPSDIDYRMKYEKMRIAAAFDHFEKGRRAFNAGDLDTAKQEWERSLQLDATIDAAIDGLAKIKDVELNREHNKPEERTIEDMKTESRTDPSFQSQMQPKVTAPISFKMTNDSKVIFESLADYVGFNVIFDRDFRGVSVPVDLNSVDIYEALDIVCMQTGSFWQPLNKNTILVSQDNQTKRREYEQQIVKTIYLSNSVSATEITEAITALRTILNMRYIAQITAMNAIILRDTPDKVAIAEMILGDVDKSKPEVVVEAMILEVDRDATRNLGLSPPTSLSTTFNGAASTTSTTTTDATTGTTTTTTTPTTTSTTTNNNVNLNQLGSIGTGSFSVAIPSITAQALASSSNARLLQNPKVRATDGKLASIRIGSKVPVPSGSFQPAFVGATGTPVVQFVYQDIGVNLDITPHVMLNHEVSLTVVVQVSALANYENVGGLQLPVFTNRSINHEIRLAEGETNVLGGIITNSESTSMSGLPWLKDIPGLKFLFGQEMKQRDETEIVVMLTPHIVRMPHLTEENMKGFYIGTEVNTRLRVPGTITPAPTAKAPTPAAGAPTPAPAAPARPLPPGVTIGTPTPPPPPAPVAPRPANAIVSFNPSPLTLIPGQATPVNIAINGADIYAADLSLSFDPSALKIQDIRDGGFLSRDGQIIALVQKIESESGVAHISIERPPGAPPLSGTGAIITLMVQPGSRKGDSQLKVVDFQLRDAQQNVLVGRATETKVTTP